MTTSNLMSLPIDISWKRLCVSDDMIERKICDRKFPYRWRSSVAVFSYEPPEEYQEYEGMIVSYLKIACTITGYQPNPEEVGIKDRRLDSYWKDSNVIENYKKKMSKYYGCYGAIIEVAVTPSGSEEEVAEIPPSKYPYFADFQPKKREIYEVTSETGEMMSRSLGKVNVRKGATTTDTHEVLDIFGGAGGSLQYGSEKAKIAVSGQVQGQWGTRDIHQEEYANIRTTDHAREMRERFSHTTQLTQMYHQLNSYHLGTNRVFFFILPRPHIVQSEYTFVNGPRLLEGIQEFFLVVMRPKDIKDICVEAYLETAHIASEPVLKHKQSVGVLTLKLDKQAVEVDLPGTSEDSQDQPAEKTQIYTPPPGWEVDLSRDGGYKVSASGSGIYEYKVTAVKRDHVTVWAKVTARYLNRFWDDIFEDAGIDITITVYIREKKPKPTGEKKEKLWLTGRGVCCCPPKIAQLPAGDWFIWQTPFLDTGQFSIGGDESMSIQMANQARDKIGRLLLQCINHPDRYAFGTMRFAESQLVADTVAELVQTVGHPDDQSVTEIKGLDPAIGDKIAQIAPRIPRSRLLQMSFTEQMDRFGLSADEVRHVRRAAIGLEVSESQPPPTEQIVPTVVGMLLEEARDLLTRMHLTTNEEVVYQDSVEPHDVVLNQFPNAGTTLERGRIVNLIVSNGPVAVPDIVGLNVDEATVRLEELSLRVEKSFAVSDEQPEGHVLETTPSANIEVPRNSQVVLLIARKA